MTTPYEISPIDVLLDVSKVVVPSLLGFDVLENQQLVADTILNSLVKGTIIAETSIHDSYVIDDWFFPLHRIDNHVYPSMSTTSKLLRLFSSTAVRVSILSVLLSCPFLIHSPSVANLISPYFPLFVLP